MTATVSSIRDALHTVAINGAYNASRALSKWLRRAVRLTGDGFQPVSIRDAVTVIGEPDDVIAAVHLRLEGDVTGHMLLTFPEPVARTLVDLITQAPQGTTTSFGELEQSCLQETGNIVCSAYANSLAKWLKLHIAPAVPEFACDMVGSVVEPLLMDLAAKHDVVFASMTDFFLDTCCLRWGLLLLPSPESLVELERLCESDDVRRHALQTIAINGAFEASRAASKWLKRGVKISTGGFSRLPLRQVAEQFDDSTPLVALHMPLGEQLQGHALLALSLPHAKNLIDMVMGQPLGTCLEIGEMERSALEETGNIIGSAFLNSWANWLDRPIEPTSPQFAVDLPSAVVESLLAEQARFSDEAFLARTDFIVNDRWAEWVFLLLPAPSSLRLIESSCQ